MATSAFAAFVDKYATLTNALEIYTFDAPVQVDESQAYPAYVVALDGGTTPTFDFEHNVVEITEITLMIYADTLDAVDAAVEIAKYNGGGTRDGLGLDFGSLPSLTVPYTRLDVQRQSEMRFAAKSTGKSAQRIHGCEMRYQVTVFRS